MIVDLTEEEINILRESLKYSKYKIENHDYCCGHYDGKAWEEGNKRRRILLEELKQCEDKLKGEKNESIT